jgi:hypothetical protein
VIKLKKKTKKNLKTKVNFFGFLLLINTVKSQTLMFIVRVKKLSSFNIYHLINNIGSVHFLPCLLGEFVCFYILT